MLDGAFYREKFSQAQPYNTYVATGDDEQRRRWARTYSTIGIDPQQKATINTFSRKMYVLVISGIWCGDCVAQGPMLARIAEVNSPLQEVRFIDRDQDKTLSGSFLMNDGTRVPTAIFLSEDFTFCGAYGDRTLTRYRSIGQRQLGIATGSTSEEQDTADTLQEWINEFERIQWMLRLSPRLREKYGD